MRYGVGIGGNLGNVPETFQKAFLLVNEEIGEVVSISRWYYSKPLPVVGEVEQGEYLNAVFIVETSLEPEEVLEKLLGIELRLGRDRKNSYHWGPRTIDLDIVCAEKLVHHSRTLDIPHPRMHERDFVLKPLLELEPEWVHPEKHITLKELYEMLPQSERYVDREYQLSQ